MKRAQQMALGALWRSWSGALYGISIETWTGTGASVTCRYPEGHWICFPISSLALIDFDYEEKEKYFEAWWCRTVSPATTEAEEGRI